MNPAAAHPIELRLAPGHSRLLSRLLLLLIALAVLAVALLVRSFILRVPEPTGWLGLVFGGGLLWRLWLTWRGLQRLPVPHELAFRGDGRVLVTLSPNARAIECVPGALVLAGDFLAFTLCPSVASAAGGVVAPLGSNLGRRVWGRPARLPGTASPSFKNIHWLSGIDAVGDENWRRLRVWLVWNRRARKIRR